VERGKHQSGEGRIDGPERNRRRGGLGVRMPLPQAVGAAQRREAHRRHQQSVALPARLTWQGPGALRPPAPEQPMPRDILPQDGRHDGQSDGEPELQGVVQRDLASRVRYGRAQEGQPRHQPPRVIAVGDTVEHHVRGATDHR
jgi:hypothetical protein